jgi:hypothetical protein
MHNEEGKLEYPPFDTDAEWYRLIPSRFPPVDLYERLPPAARAAAPVLEEMTNPRLASKARLTGGNAGVDENSPQLQNWNHAPFAYRNPEGSFLLGPSYGVMELARTLDDALAIAVRRREIFLSRTAEPPMDLDMRVFSTPVKGRFLDLRWLALDLTEEARREIGRQALADNALGAVFHRPERPRSDFLAVFNLSAVGRTVQGKHYRFVWDGHVIRSLYDFNTSETIPRSALLSDTSGREAA